MSSPKEKVKIVIYTVSPKLFKLEVKHGAVLGSDAASYSLG